MACTEMGLHLLEPWMPKRPELQFLRVKLLFKGIAQKEDFVTEERMRVELRETELKLVRPDKTAIDTNSFSSCFRCVFYAAFWSFSLLLLFLFFPFLFLFFQVLMACLVTRNRERDWGMGLWVCSPKGPNPNFMDLRRRWAQALRQASSFFFFIYYFFQGIMSFPNCCQ